MATKKKKAAKGKHTARRSGYEVEISLSLFGLGALLVVMLFVEGQALWSTLRGWLFGVFGLNMYLLGMALIYLAVKVARGEPVWPRVFKGLFLMVSLSGLAVIFSDLQMTDASGALLTGEALVQQFLRNGSESLLGGGLLGIPAGGALLAACGRPAANIIAVVLCLCALMLATGITPAEVWEFTALKLGGAASDVKRRSSEAKEDMEARRAERQERLEALRAQREQEEAERAAREEADAEARESGLHRLKMNWRGFFRRDPAEDESAPAEEAAVQPAQPEQPPQPVPPLPLSLPPLSPRCVSRCSRPPRSPPARYIPPWWTNSRPPLPRRRSRS